MSLETNHRASRLAAALHAKGINVGVESRGALALITPTAAELRPISNDERQAMLQLAREAGYSHAALEIIRL